MRRSKVRIVGVSEGDLRGKTREKRIHVGGVSGPVDV